MFTIHHAFKLTQQPDGSAKREPSQAVDASKAGQPLPIEQAMHFARVEIACGRVKLPVEIRRDGILYAVFRNTLGRQPRQADVAIAVAS